MLFKFCVVIILLNLKNVNAANKAVLVAGSRLYQNYRHQATIAHAYHVLINQGYLRENTVVMMFDDAAKDINNPDRGHLYNDPRYVNYYEGLWIECNSRDSVDFMRILTISVDQSKLGSQLSVLKINKDDNVFIYLVGYGRIGSFLFDGTSLYADAFVHLLENLKDWCNNIMIVVGASYSGSLFKNLLTEKHEGIIAITSSSHDRPSYAELYDTRLGVFLTDSFSKSFLDYLENADVANETLSNLYAYLTENNGESKPQIFGDKTLLEEKLSTFFPEPFKRSENFAENYAYLQKIHISEYEGGSYISSLKNTRDYYVVNKGRWAVNAFNSYYRANVYNGSYYDKINFDVNLSEHQIACYEDAVQLSSEKCVLALMAEEFYHIHNMFYSLCQNYPSQIHRGMIVSVCG